MANVFDDDEIWQAVEITENGKTWYEVRRGMLYVVRNGVPIRFTKEKAIKERDRLREEEHIQSERTETIVRD